MNSASQGPSVPTPATDQAMAMIMYVKSPIATARLTARAGRRLADALILGAVVISTAGAALATVFADQIFNMLPARHGQASTKGRR